MLVGALAAFAVTVETGQVWVGAVAGAAAGALLATVHAWVVVYRNASQLATGLAVLFMALGVTSFVRRLVLSRATFTASRLAGAACSAGFRCSARRSSTPRSARHLSYAAVRRRGSASCEPAGGADPHPPVSGRSVACYGVSPAPGAEHCGRVAAHSPASVDPAVDRARAHVVRGGWRPDRGFIAVALVIFAAWNPLRALGGAVPVRPLRSPSGSVLHGARGSGSTSSFSMRCVRPDAARAVVCCAASGIRTRGRSARASDSPYQSQRKEKENESSQKTRSSRLRNAGLLALTLALTAGVWGSSSIASTRTKTASTCTSPAGQRGPVRHQHDWLIYVGSRSDFGYNEAAHFGARRLQGLSQPEDLERTRSRDLRQVTAAEQMIAQGAKIIFSTSYGYKGYAVTLAGKHPDVAVPPAGQLHDAAGAGERHTYFGNVLRDRLPGGLPRARHEEHKLGSIAAFPIPQTLLTSMPSRLGAQTVDPKVKTSSSSRVTVRSGEAGDAANSLLASGVDVLTQHQTARARSSRRPEAKGAYWSATTSMRSHWHRRAG